MVKIEKVCGSNPECLKYKYKHCWAGWKIMQINTGFSGKPEWEFLCPLKNWGEITLQEYKNNFYIKKVKGEE